jgi:hypothetical protein
MLFSNACRFVLYSILSFSANAETVRGAQRELKEDKIELLTAGNYVILAKSGISTVPNSAITGDIAVSPIAATALTGFGLTADSSTTFSTSTQIVGKAFAANYAVPTPMQLTTAVGDMEAAYDEAAGRANNDAARANLGSGALGGEFGGASGKLTPGVYTFGSDVNVEGNIYFRGSGSGVGKGGETDVFIIQISGDLIQVNNTNVILENGALASNLFWQVAGKVTVGDGAHMEGIILVKTHALFETSSSLHGRVLAQTACDLEQATITQPVN